MMSSLKKKPGKSLVEERKGKLDCLHLPPGLEGRGGSGGRTPVGSLQLWASGSLAAVLFETLSASGLPQTIRVAEVCFVKSRQQPAPHNGPLEKGEHTIFSFLND